MLQHMHGLPQPGHSSPGCCPALHARFRSQEQICKRNPLQCPQQEHVKFCLKWGFKYQTGVTEQPGGAIAANKLRGGPEAASYLSSLVKQPSSAL